MDADTMTELAASYRRHQEQTAIEQHLAHVGNDTHTAVASQWNGQRWISRDGARERGFHRESNNPLEGGCVLDDARRRRTVPRAGAAAEVEAASEGEGGGRGGTGEGEEGGSGGDGLGGAQYRAMMERLAGGSGGGGLALPQLVPSNSTAEMLPAGGLFPSPIKSSASGASAEAEAGQADEAQCCAICLEKKMVDPTTTPCKHVFCRKCVDSFLNAKLRARNDRRRRGGGGGSGGFGGASGEEGLDDFLRSVVGQLALVTALPVLCPYFLVESARNDGSTRHKKRPPLATVYRPRELTPQPPSSAVLCAELHSTSMAGSVDTGGTGGSLPRSRAAQTATGGTRCSTSRARAATLRGGAPGRAG